MRAAPLAWLIVAAFDVAGCASPHVAHPAVDRSTLDGRPPADVYAAYQRALADASDVDEVLAFVTAVRRRAIEAMDDRARHDALTLMKATAIESMRVDDVHLHDALAVLTVAGTQTSLVNGARTEAHGRVTLVLEGRAWEVDCEEWTIGEEGPHAIADRADTPPPPTLPSAPFPARA